MDKAEDEILERKKKLHYYISKCFLENRTDYKKDFEDSIFKYLKQNKSKDISYKKVVGIKITQDENGFIYINDKYLVLDKKCKYYNTTHFNSVVFFKNEKNITIFGGSNQKEKEILNFLISKEFLRKFKILNLIYGI